MLAGALPGVGERARPCAARARCHGRNRSAAIIARRPTGGSPHNQVSGRPVTLWRAERPEG